MNGPLEWSVDDPIAAELTPRARNEPAPLPAFLRAH